MLYVEDGKILCSSLKSDRATALPHYKDAQICLLRAFPVCAEIHLNSPRTLADSGMLCSGEQQLALPVGMVWEAHFPYFNTSCISSQRMLQITLLFFPGRGSAVAACGVSKMPAVSVLNECCS